jgi:4-hydroxybenzoate polyprenyltransferase
VNLFKRLWIYQSERFPIFQHGLMVLTFTFSAASFSRICRGEIGFIEPIHFVAGFLSSLGFFCLLRLFDEFKDAEEDAQYRPYRAVPRGLVSLKELGWLAVLVIACQVTVNLFVMPKMLWAYALALLYIALMSKEFFVAEWLKKRPLLYMASHMMVMPLIDFYTTGLDWINAGVLAPKGLVFFLVVTFLNGIVIEFGRKIRAEEAEEEGVETYSALYGAKKASIAWLGILLMTFAFAVMASYVAGFGKQAILFLIPFLLICALPACLFLKKQTQTYAKKIELASGVWTIGMYLTLGAVPMLIHYVGN